MGEHKLRLIMSIDMLCVVSGGENGFPEMLLIVLGRIRDMLR